MRDAIDRAVDVVLKRCEGIVRAETRHKSPVRARILKGIDALRPKPLPIGAARVPIGAHVVRDFEGRKLIGEVVESFERTGCMRLRVKHFNGEPWPVEPLANSVEVLDRTKGGPDDIPR
jgi:hypothetical protein